jgi:hypothetical protein
MKGIFAVNSTLASGPHEAVLFDAQFQRQRWRKAGRYDQEKAVRN